MTQPRRRFRVREELKDACLGRIRSPVIHRDWVRVRVSPPPNSDSPGRHPEVFLDEVAGDGQREQGDKEDGGHVADDPQGRNAQQGGAGETLQGGGDVLVDGVDVRGEPVEDASEGSGLKQPEGMRRNRRMIYTERMNTQASERLMWRLPESWVKNSGSRSVKRGE